MIGPSKPALSQTQRSVEPPGGEGSNESVLSELDVPSPRSDAREGVRSDPKARQTLPGGDGAAPARPGALDAAAATVSAALRCLTDDEILQYGQGQASAALLARIDAHLDGCRRCQELVDLTVADQRELDGSPSQLTTFHEEFIVAHRYRIERFLGRGGMGEVYAAFDELTGSRVALKTVLCTSSDDPRAIRKLFAEVLNAQRVAHPHVFKIYDLHEHRDDRRGRVPFFTMEYLEGESLGKRLRREGRLPISEVRAIAEQLLAGLSAAHERGVLHLDFKSDNVMLRSSSPRPDAVIMDFGLSRASDVEARQHTSERLQAAGTMPYMSLEQLECRGDLDAAADVYAFGVVLYEMLAGQLPFRGESISAMLLKQLTERPAPLTRLVPQLSPSVEAFVFKCLQRRSSERYPNAGAALAALSSIRDFTRSSRASRTARRAAPVVLLALVAGIAAATAWGNLDPGRTETLAEETRTALSPAAASAPPVPTTPPAPPAMAHSPTIGTGASPAENNAATSPPSAAAQPRQPAPPPRPTRDEKARASRPGRSHGTTNARHHDESTADPAPSPAVDTAPSRAWRGQRPRAIPTPLPLR